MLGVLAWLAYLTIGFVIGVTATALWVRNENYDGADQALLWIIGSMLGVVAFCFWPMVALGYAMYRAARWLSKPTPRDAVR